MSCLKFNGHTHTHYFLKQKLISITYRITIVHFEIFELGDDLINRNGIKKDTVILYFFFLIMHSITGSLL